MKPVNPDLDFPALQDEGRLARKRLPRSAHADLATLDRDPIAILEDQHHSRVQRLVPLRISRMLQSPFAFYRGTAAIMAHDLAQQPNTNAHVISCGDAHTANFGMFATPERNLTFELNDFDEANPAPWEWDLKRLATSILLGGAEANHSSKVATSAAREAIRTYRESLNALCKKPAIDRYYYRVGQNLGREDLNVEAAGLIARAIKRARRRSSPEAMEALTEPGPGGTPRLIEQPGRMEHVNEFSLQVANSLLTRYLMTVRVDIAQFLRQFEQVDVAMRVVGVGSVGTRCFLSLLIGPRGEHLILQIKEAQASVLETYGGMPRISVKHPSRRRSPEGFRVVAAQQILQTASDPFLGYFRSDGRDYYVRQFRDMKGTIDTNSLSPSLFRSHAVLCASLLARAHAQSQNVAFISGYLGASGTFDDAVVQWATAYAGQVAQDYAALETAVADGRMPALPTS